MQEIDLTKIAALSLRRLGEEGFGLSCEADLRLFEESMEELGKRENYPMISAAWHDLSSSDAFGLLINRAGQGPVGGVAARHLNLGRDSLQEHWESSYARLYPGDVPPISGGAAIASRMRGRIVYLGELFLCEEWRGGRVNLPAVMHCLHALVALKWRPDWVYGFIRIRGIRVAAEFGFSRTYPGAQNWLRSVDRRGVEECLVAVTFDEFCERANYFVRHPENFAPRKSGQIGKQ